MKAVRSFLKQHAKVEFVFWDFASVYQKDDKLWEEGPENGGKEYDESRTPEEEDAFEKALDVQAALYAHPNTLVIQHTELPSAEPQLKSYRDSAFCCFEEACAMLVTRNGGQLYSLDQGKLKSLHRGRLWTTTRKSPDAMDSDLKSKGFRKDRVCQKLSTQYRTYFQQMDKVDVAPVSVFYSREFVSGLREAFGSKKALQICRFLLKPWKMSLPFGLIAAGAVGMTTDTMTELVAGLVVMVPLHLCGLLAQCCFIALPLFWQKWFYHGP
jgi:hypothetical protein